MAKKNEQVDILKMIEGLSPEDQQKLIAALVPKTEEEPKKKVRRKHYKQQEQQSRKTKPKKGEYINEFEKSPLFNAHKQDAEIDKKLWANHEPMERRDPVKFVTQTCKSCGKQEQVASHLVFNTGRNEAAAFYCNKCVVKRG